MSLQKMMKKNAIAKVSFRYGSMSAFGRSFAHLLGCCNITAEVAKSRDQQDARSHKVNGYRVVLLATSLSWKLNLCMCMFVFTQKNGEYSSP